MEEMLWVTKDGQPYLVGNMTTSHVKNSLAMIEKSGMRWRARFYDRLVLELEIRAVTGHSSNQVM